MSVPATACRTSPRRSRRRFALNVKGYERLAATGLDRVNFTLAATESFSRRNANQSMAEARAAAAEVIERSELPVTVTISVAFGCPFEGRVDPGVVAGLASELEAAEIVLADTIGVATPRQVRALVERTRAPGVHLHNTRNTGYANAVAALDAGATLFDASPASCTRRSTPSVSSSLAKRKSTWFNTTSLSSSTPGTETISSANCRAHSHVRSTRSQSPLRPSERSAA